MTTRFPTFLCAAAALFTVAAAQAETVVRDAWVRGTVAQQKATGLFAQITSSTGGKLVGAASPVAGVVEVHEMSMDGGVMKMRAIPALDLPAGKTVELKPGGYHVMLMDLKQPLKAGDSVPLTLTVEGADGKREQVSVQAGVRDVAAPAASAPHAHDGMKH